MHFFLVLHLKHLIQITETNKSHRMMQIIRPGGLHSAPMYNLFQVIVTKCPSMILLENTALWSGRPLLYLTRLPRFTSIHKVMVFGAFQKPGFKYLTHCGKSQSILSIGIYLISCSTLVWDYTTFTQADYIFASYFHHTLNNVFSPEPRVHVWMKCDNDKIAGCLHCRVQSVTLVLWCVLKIQVKAILCSKHRLTHNATQMHLTCGEQHWTSGILYLMQ